MALVNSFLTQLFVLGALLPVVDSCAQVPTQRESKRMPSYQTEKFLLTAGPCAADGYWVTLQGGAFICSDGSSFAVPSGHTLQGNWGASGTTWSSGDDRHPAPERLSLTWFAYAEDKFYKGEFALPQETIHQLLRQGSWDLVKQKKVTYNRLTVCVLPKGVAVVWLTGGNQVLIGRFQASEFFPSADQYARYYGQTNRALMVKNTRAELPGEVQAQITAGTLNTSRWDEWLKLYPWQVTFNVPFPLYRYAFYGANAERTRNPTTQDLAPYRQFVLSPQPKPVPTAVSFYGTTEHGAHYVVRIKAFDEAETQAAFEALHKLDPAGPMTLLFTIDKPFQKATMVLKNDRKEIPLTKSKLEVLSED